MSVVGSPECDFKFSLRYHTNAYIQAPLLRRCIARIQVYTIDTRCFVGAMADSPSDPKLTTKHPALCALAGCQETAEVLCRECMSTPNIGIPDARLPDVAYCSEGHLKQDSNVHLPMCAYRQWLRYIGRVGEFHYLVFSIDCQRKSYLALQGFRWSEYGTTLEIAYRSMKSGEPFCGDDVDEDIKLCALYQGHCVHALILGAGLMAYLSQSKLALRLLLTT